MKMIIFLFLFLTIYNLFSKEFVPINIFNTGSSISRDNNLQLISSIGNPSFNNLLSDNTEFRLGILSLVKHPLPLEISEKDFKQNFSLSEAFPNPSSDNFSLQLKIFSKIQIKIRFFDFLGNNIFEKKDGDFDKGNYNLTFNTKNIRNGIYFIEFIDGFHSVLKKIIIAK